MTQSDNLSKTENGSAFMSGPKPGAPIPKYEPGSDRALRERLRNTSSATPIDHAPVEQDAFNIAGIEGRIDRKKANIAARLVDSDPDQALRVIRNWLSNDG